MTAQAATHWQHPFLFVCFCIKTPPRVYATVCCVRQVDAAAKFSNLDAGKLKKLLDCFKAAARAYTRVEFDGLAEALKGHHQEFYDYVFNAYPPTTWANRGGTPFSTFNVITSNSSGAFCDGV